MIGVAVLTLLVSAGLFWGSSYLLTAEVPVICGASGNMEPGEQCKNLRSGAVRSYSEEQAAERSAQDMFGWGAFIVGIGVVVVGAVAMRLAWKGDSLMSRVHRSLMEQDIGRRQA